MKKTILLWVGSILALTLAIALTCSGCGKPDGPCGNYSKWESKHAFSK
jgi:hypothetical protein